jgi:uncharacterized protein
MVIELKWLWDEEKNQINQRKHGLSFEAAQYVFADPFALSLPVRGACQGQSISP